MAQRLVTYILLSVIVSVTLADYDPTKCTLDTASSTSIPTPSFADNFYVFQEKKTMDTGGNNFVANIGFYFSRYDGRAYLHERVKGNTTDSWVVTSSDQIINAVVSPNDQGCHATTLEGSRGGLFMMTSDNGTGVTLGQPSEVMQFARGSIKRNFIGPDYLQDRGIFFNQFQSCQYFKESDSSMKVTYFFSDPSVMKMPNSNNGLLVRAEVVGHSGSMNQDFHYRYDFSHNFFNIDSSTDPHFELPVDLYCAKAKVTQTLPKIPDYFRYKGEQVTTYKSGGGPAQLQYFQETYYRALSLFVVDNESAKPNSPGDVAYYRSVTDFNTGLQYVMDLKGGFCQMSKISVDNNAAVSIANGMVSMRTSGQFFDLDSDHYQYMGKHQHLQRGIAADVYSVYWDATANPKRRNSLFAWYFATSNWQKTMGYRTTYTMPVTLMVEQGDAKQVMNFFEWSTEVDRSMPDISMCYNVSSAIPVEVYFNGRYDQIVTPDPMSFKTTFMVNAMALGGVVSPLRISSIDVQPAGNNQIVVRFLLLERPGMVGNVQNPAQEASAATVYSQLISSLSSGDFIMTVNRKQNAGSVQVTASAIGKFNTAGFHGVKVHIPSVNPYSGGAMAGIGLGMLVAGLLLGVIGVLVYKKACGGGSIGGGIDTGMSRFNNDN